MQFQQDFKGPQSNMHFNFPEVQDFEPEYMPEVISPVFIDTSVSVSYSKQSWFKKMLALPRVASFVLESLEKISSFSNDINNSVSKVASRVSILEASQGDFRSLNDRLQQVEMKVTDLPEMNLQIQELTKKNRIITIAMLVMALVNLGLAAFLFIK
ncbi:hypothetical protein [Peredibacter starrii]|uniref:Methyl-accepting chemotaxis protein n=1 Tax=Peredibacter starrii TaxID=28202 RepID=A0AAX4HTM0_9BACT|nr:hypothetical protein [Peredibacter starrii]WPU66545.1 hypothetical protein SOO65_07285 [Peredibacter starrii]